MAGCEQAAMPQFLSDGAIAMPSFRNGFLPTWEDSDIYTHPFEYAIWLRDTAYCSNTDMATGCRFNSYRSATYAVEFVIHLLSKTSYIVIDGATYNRNMLRSELYHRLKYTPARQIIFVKANLFVKAKRYLKAIGSVLRSKLRNKLDVKITAVETTAVETPTPTPSTAPISVGTDYLLGKLADGCYVEITQLHKKPVIEDKFPDMPYSTAKLDTDLGNCVPIKVYPVLKIL